MKDRTQSPVLRAAGLTKYYGKRLVVDNVSFQLHAGEMVAFLGRNGAGKTSVIRMLCGLVHPSAGQVWLDDTPILGASARHRKSLGAIVEAPRFYPFLTARRNLEWVSRLLGAEAEVPGMLERVGLRGREDERVDTYSLGMKQRLGLAAAFLHRPRVVILDEPTNGLDPVGYAQMHELLRSLVRESGTSVLLCTHQLAEAAALCERALVIDRGQIVLNESLVEAGGLAKVQGLFDRIAACGTSI